MGVIKVDTDAVASAASQFTGQSASLEELIGQVTKTLNALEPLWAGTAATSFVALMTQWNTDIGNIQQVLTQVGTRVAQAGVAYGDTDTSIANSFK